MKYCLKCGAENADNAKFCTECGAALNTAETIDTTTEILSYSVTEKSNTSEEKYTYNYSTDNNQTNFTPVTSRIVPRNIALAVILSIVTCGIYQIYWFIKLNNEVNILANDPDAPSGGIAFLLSFITCGIYGFFWSYKMGEKCDKIKGINGGSSAILYLILTFVGLGIVTFCLIQDSINKTA